MTHQVLDYLVLVSAIRYRDKDNQWRELPFEGAYCTKDGHFYNRDGLRPRLPIKEPVLAFGSKGRCLCCENWLDRTPCTEILYPDGSVLHVPHFAARCTICRAAGQFTSATCPTHSQTSSS